MNNSIKYKNTTSMLIQTNLLPFLGNYCTLIRDAYKQKSKTDLSQNTSQLIPNLHGAKLSILQSRS